MNVFTLLGEVRQLEGKIHHAQDFMECIISQLYGKETIDRDKLEWYIEEVCSALDVKVPKTTDLRITKQ